MGLHLPAHGQKAFHEVVLDPVRVRGRHILAATPGKFGLNRLPISPGSQLSEFLDYAQVFGFFLGGFRGACTLSCCNHLS